jgi:hypothetical protein
VPELKVLIQPADRSSIVEASGPPKFVPAAQLEEQAAACSVEIARRALAAARIALLPASGQRFPFLG